MRERSSQRATAGDGSQKEEEADGAVDVRSPEAAAAKGVVLDSYRRRGGRRRAVASSKTTFWLPKDAAEWGDRAGTLVDARVQGVDQVKEDGSTETVYPQQMTFPDWNPTMPLHEKPLPPFYKPSAPWNEYCGHSKGKKQVLFERALFNEETWTDPSKDRSKKRKSAFMVEKGHLRDGDVVPGTSMNLVLSQCQDFLNEKTLLEQLVTDLGHILEKSPKCHPELAGAGIEYCWGKSKREYRKINSGDQKTMCAEQRARVLSCLSPEVLPRRRLRKFDRKAYEYKCVYRKLAEDGDAADSLAKIEKMKAECKKHRTITQADMTILNTPVKAA